MTFLHNRRRALADIEDSQIGYSKPPKSSQFKKGQSGNPKGRPKGSVDMATLFEKTIRQKVTIIENGRSRVVIKAEAMFLQMVNKAAKGDMNATNEVRYWSQRFDDFPKIAGPGPVLHESDETVMEGMIKRMQEANILESKSATNPEIASQNQREA
jgi:Family of unknown function (DUF5681)